MGRGVIEIDGSVADAVPRAPVLGGRQTPLPQLDAYARDLAAVTREAVLAAFCGEIERLMALPMEAVLAEYGELDLLRGRTIRVHHKTREESDPRDFDAKAMGVDASGQLRVRPTAGGPEKALSGEEVSISPLDLGGGSQAAEGECKTS